MGTMGYTTNHSYFWPLNLIDGYDYGIASISWDMSIAPKWGPQTIAKLVYNSKVTMVYGTYNYTFFKVDGSALFQSARIDGADFLNFDTRKGRDIHPRYFCGPRHLCQKMLPMCFRVAPSMQGAKGKEKGERERKRRKGAGKGKGKGEGERRKGKGQ